MRTPTADTNPYFAILIILAALMDPGPPEKDSGREFDFDPVSSLERFLASKAATHIFDDEGRRLFRRLKLAEFRSAQEFGKFENERAALVKIL